MSVSLLPTHFSCILVLLYGPSSITPSAPGCYTTFPTSHRFTQGVSVSWLQYHIASMLTTESVTTFTGLDFVVEILIAQGASRMARVNSSVATIQTGATLIAAGLLLQIVVALSFAALLVHFHFRCRQHKLVTKNIRTILFLNYTTIGLLVCRMTYRTIEGFQVRSRIGKPARVWEGTVKASEPAFWVFEGAFMLAISVRHMALSPQMGGKAYSRLLCSCLFMPFIPDASCLATNASF